MQVCDVDARSFRRVMGKFATGVTVVSFIHEGQPTGMTANAFMSLSVDPPMVLIAVRTQARFASSIKPGDAFGISFLREDHEGVSSHFGGRPVPDHSPSFIDLARPRYWKAPWCNWRFARMPCTSVAIT